MDDYNNAAEAVTEGHVGEWLGRKASERYRDQPEILAELHACVTEQRTRRRETHLYGNSGQVGQLAITYVFVPPQTVMLHTEDVSDAMHAEQRRDAMAQSEQLRALGQMASGVARDLSQSLMLVASYSDLARQALLHDPPNLLELHDLLTTTTRAPLDSGETVRRLLVFTRSAPEEDGKRVDRSSVMRDAA